MKYFTSILVLIITTIFLSGFSTNSFGPQKQSIVSFQDTIKRTKVKVEVVETDTFVNKIFLKSQLYKKKAHASYYHDKFNGKKTSSGVRFSNSKYTAAHRKLPFGTHVRITNEENGKSVVVEINDRGPFTKGRDIDLSHKAFSQIASNKISGTMIVTIEVVH